MNYQNEEKENSGLRGVPVDRRKLCPHCLTKGLSEAVYCNDCGTLLRVYVLSGGRLITLPGVSMYEGEGTFSIAKARGDLTVFDDRVVFTPGRDTFLMGLLNDRTTPKAPEILSLNQIRFARVGRRMGLAALIVGLPNERTVCFTSLGQDEGILSKTAELIEEYKLVRASQEI